MRHPLVVTAIVPVMGDRCLDQVIDMAHRWTDTVVLLGDDDWPDEASISVVGNHLTTVWWTWAWRRLVTELALQEGDYVVPLTGSEVIYNYQNVEGYVWGAEGKTLYGTRYRMVDFDGRFVSAWPWVPEEKPLAIPVRNHTSFLRPWEPQHALLAGNTLVTDLRTQEYSIAVGTLKIRDMNSQAFDGEVLLNEPEHNIARDGSIRG